MAIPSLEYGVAACSLGKDLRAQTCRERTWIVELEFWAAVRVHIGDQGCHWLGQRLPDSLSEREANLLVDRGKNESLLWLQVLKLEVGNPVTVSTGQQVE